MNTKLSPLFVFLSMLALAGLACSASFNPPCVSLGDACNKAATPAPAEASQAEAVPAAVQAQTATSYEVKGDTVEVFADGKMIAKVKFVTKVDNMPTEWLRDREGIMYLYQSGIGNEVKLEVTLLENGAFAADGDAFQVGETTLGKVNDSADALVFADTPGKYTITGWSFGIAFGPHKAEDDKAGFVLKDRHNAINWDARPEYWLNPTGSPVQVGQ